MPGTFSNLLLHIVFSTKHREPLITPDIEPRLHKFIGGIVRDERGKLMEIGGVADHVHLLVSWRTDETIASLVRNVKARSSAWVQKTFADHRAFAWQEGYGVFTVSHSQMATVARYIRSQPEHHRRTSFKEEFLKLLKRHDIEYDERYVFD
jgi:REP element-mobilizing transposase RayT